LSLSPSPQAAKYIAEREEKRARGLDILKHRAYNANDAGIMSFAGIREIDGQDLALLKSGNEILVMPMDAAASRRLKRSAIGDHVTLTAEGAVKTKGRSR
jgi:hypothetical protein